MRLNVKKYSRQIFCFFILILPPSFFFAGETPLFPLQDTGIENPVNFESYGRFENVGTSDYRYIVTDRRGLAKAVGTGIYPNETGIFREPVYQKYVKLNRLVGSLEEFQPLKKPQLAFFKWASMSGGSQPGLRLFNVAKCLELSGYSKQALKAYYSIVVHFPKEVMWQEGRPWYIGVAALDSVYRLLEQNPPWGLTLVDAGITVENGFDRKGTNDVFIVNPGHWAKGRLQKKSSGPLGYVKKFKGVGKVQLAQYQNGHWRLFVEGKPYIIRGVSYSPSPVGRSPDWDNFKPHSDWMEEDTNNNGIIDAPYESWVDENGNNQRDHSENPVGDFKLLQKMGANTIRLYHHGENKELLKDLNERYGIRVLMGDLLGAYTVGSDASWEQGTDYNNPEQRENMRRSVQEMVMGHRNEDYVLMWVLGNENNYGHGNNADLKPQVFLKFVNSIARMIKLLDPDRPVALSIGDIEYIDIVAREAPEIDVLAINAYRGMNGMGKSFWQNLARVWKKPVLIGEFGCPAYAEGMKTSDIEKAQSTYLLNNWKDIMVNSAGYGMGNSLGGVLFEWVDEWWKSGPQGDVWSQDTTVQFNGPFIDGSMYEEWLGVATQGDGNSSPFLRRLRPAFYAFKNGPWKESLSFPLRKKRSIALNDEIK
ncbi:MAG: glycoside hydrolase family 2 TIM barrel-domain containing protein [Elusimicrobiota bacterium]